MAMKIKWPAGWRDDEGWPTTGKLSVMGEPRTAAQLDAALSEQGSSLAVRVEQLRGYDDDREGAESLPAAEPQEESPKEAPTTRPAGR